MIDTENVNTNKEVDLKEITLEQGIYDFTVPIEDFLINDKPISEEQLNILRTFEPKYSFEEDIAERGKDSIIKDLEASRKFFNFEEAKKAVEEGLSLAQMINPDIKILGFPVIFLFNPKYGDAKSLHGQGCAININSLMKSDFHNDTQYQKIVSFTAHEATHVFLKQLGKTPLNFNLHRDPLKKGIYDFLWEEGLTTYIEPTHYRHHDVIVEDAKFWIDLIKEWLETKDQNKKNEIFRKCMNLDSTKVWFEVMKKNPQLPENFKATDSLFISMLTEMNGPGYHIGSYLWRKQIEKGDELKDLVMMGSEEMSHWIGEE